MLRRLASVRARTTLLAVLLTGLTLTAASVLLVLSLDRSLGHNDDVVDRARVHDLARLAGTGSLPRRLDAGGEGVAQVVGPGGGVIAASANVAGRGLVTSYRPPAGGLVVRTVRDAPDDDETETYRVWMLTTPTAAGPVTSYVGTSTEARHEATRILRARPARRGPAAGRAARGRHLGGDRAGTAARWRTCAPRWPRSATTAWTGGCRSRRSTTRSAGWPPP